MNSAGYAQARLQARFGARPTAVDFALLDASRDAIHFQEALRAGVFADYARGLGPIADPDGLESRLTTAWRDVCAEVSRWYAPLWQPAFAAFAAYPDIASLEYLRAGGAAQPWLLADPLLGPIARVAPRDRSGAVEAGYGGAWRSAFAGDLPLADSWRALYLSSVPATGPGVVAGLKEVASLLAAPYGVGADTGQSAARLERLFRRHAGTPLAAFAYLALLLRMLDRLRGGEAGRLLPRSGGA